ncbi:hypothetical protein BGZ83_001041, partial [Gryganskiella cystojenkinii]
TIPELSPAANYGMGWFMDSYKGQSMYYHGGNTLGFSSNILLFPDSELVITVLSNTYGAVLRDTIPYYLADEILNLPKTKDWLGKETMDKTELVFKSSADAAAGVDLPPRLKNKPAAHPLGDYEGIYASPMFAGDVKISLETEEDADGFKKSELHFLFNTFSSKVEHYHYETFTFVFDMWSVKVKQAVTFITGQDGQVEALQLTYLEEQWTFKKQPAKETTMITSTVAPHHCNDQEDVDIRMEEEQEEEQIGYPLDNHRSSYRDWSDAIELARNKSGTTGLSVAIVHRGKVINTERFGKRDNKGDPRYSSAMTATMIGELVAEGKFDWLTPVSEYVPVAKFGHVLTAELTLSDYLSYRSLVRSNVFRRIQDSVPIQMGKQPNHTRLHYADTVSDAQAGRFHQDELGNLLSLVAPAGNAYSNVFDLLKWGSTVMHYGQLSGKQVLIKSSSVEEVLAAHTMVWAGSWTLSTSTTTPHYCDHQEEADICTENNQGEEQTVFGHDQIKQFKLI